MSEDKASYKIDTKFNYEDGVLEINIPEIIAQLDTEDREALARLHTFESAMWEELKRSVRDDHASDGFYDTIHKLRIELLSGEGADHILKKTVRGILFDLDVARRGKKNYYDNFWQLRRWCLDNLTPGKRQTMPAEIKREEPNYIKSKDVEEAIAKAQGEITDD